jgi:predicted ATPase
MGTACHPGTAIESLVHSRRMITRAVLFEQFAGRDEELQHLIDVRAASARELLGRTVSIVGEAGVGKSRLLTEFREATERERGAFVRVRCEELPVAYAPLVRALEQLQERRELRRTDALATALQLLTTADATATPEEGARKRTIFNALATAFVESARRLGQLTLAVDDVHWSDLSTLEALRALARSVRRAPMVLAITYRPEDLAADHARTSIALRSVRSPSAISRRCFESPYPRRVKSSSGASTIFPKANRTLPKSLREASWSAAST